MSTPPADADVAVVGAGAAGMMAALCAARRGKRVVLLEKNEQPGLKILISGGGRCNLTTTKGGKDLEREYGETRARFLRFALRELPPEKLRAMVEAAGVPLQEEDLDKIFPCSGKARDIVEALLRLVRESGALLWTKAPMQALARAGEGLVVTTPRGEVRARSVVLATGGLSYPRTGATGDGYAALQAFGHGLVRTVPALAPLAVDAEWVRGLSGIVLHGVELAVQDRSGRVLRARNRPILFTHKGLSGPAPMDLSGDVEELGGACTLRFDFAPEWTADALDAHLVATARAAGRRGAAAALPEPLLARLPERLRDVLATLAGAVGPLAELRADARRKLVLVLKGLEVPVERSLGFAHAEVTRGGIPLHEVDARTMQSKLVPGLFVCGELLDVDGPIGGFNFQAAFATGRVAGMHAGG